MLYSNKPNPTLMPYYKILIISALCFKITKKSSLFTQIFQKYEKIFARKFFLNLPVHENVNLPFVRGKKLFCRE